MGPMRSTMPFTQARVAIAPLLFVLVLHLLLGQLQADIYMHNPRGSNDRNCERNVARDNGNRLFNSQNNANGGYACPRAVGGADGSGAFQSESGDAQFQATDTTTGATTTFTQNKRMYYYAGSILPIEWTNQHGCGGNSKVSCEVIIQYACEDTLDPQVDNFWPWVAGKAEPTSAYYGKQHFHDIASTPQNVAAPRDGIPRDSNDAATDTIPDDGGTSATPNTIETRRFGMHESADYYQLCQRTERNKGLYTADQLVQRNDRRGTRQNPQGDRHGYECPEERDYYPWWAPSPWVDVAVLTDSGLDLPCYPGATSICSTRCQYYMNNTMNTNPKGYCDINHSTPGATVNTKLNNAKWQQNQWYNNRPACEAAGFTWYMISHKQNLALNPGNNFVCGKTQFSRVNQLGNSITSSVVSEDALVNKATSAAQWASTNPIVEGLNANRFIWTVPEVPAASASYFQAGMASAYKSCVLRLRYNVSSADYQPWPRQALNPDITARMVDAHNNSRRANDPNTPLRQDPYVYLGPGDLEQKGAMFLSLAVNTNQYSRTFQDRSYVFSIKPLPLPPSNSNTHPIPQNTQADTPAVDYTAIANAIARGGKIYNVNVRGKRGNIVQVYPSVEYDFTPNALKLGLNDMVHWQWTGSDYNPRRGCNDGEGGPPDANTFSTDANANINPRADRSNVVWTPQMGQNTPQNYDGYSSSADASTAPYRAQVRLAKAQTLSDAPCYDPANAAQGGINGSIAADCYQQTLRLAYLNQQLDGGSLVLRGGKNCLTQAQLDAIGNKDVANFHPLNCAKLNAKPFPYFDAGVMVMRKLGFFSFFSSRNNNFSNRQQIGIICVGRPGTTDCAENADNVLQDKNSVASSGAATAPHTSSLVCYDAAGNVNPAACVYLAPPILTAETAAPLLADGDGGQNDGNRMGCDQRDVAASSATTSLMGMSVSGQVGLAFGVLAAGVFSTWLCFFLYNRHRRQRHEAWLKPLDKRSLSANEDRVPENSEHQAPKSLFSWDSIFGGRPKSEFTISPDAQHVRAKSKVMGSIETIGQTRRLSFTGDRASHSGGTGPLPMSPPPPPPKAAPRADLL